MAGALTILVAEDDSLGAAVLQSQLQALGHRVIGPAANGQEAVDLAGREPFDLAILDVRMPRLDGVEAAEEIFRVRPVPVILLTGYDDPATVERASCAPVFHFLVKPVSPEDLAPAIAVARQRFAEVIRMHKEIEAPQHQIEERKMVERAKGIIMAARGLSDAEAYQVLEEESRRRDRSVLEVARTIVAADGLLTEYVS